ncbi:glucose 1-dehydrogenase [Streptomyces spiralis]|uniref:glucose 1-dehydrogenase n=1 Tax=Streptomyces spiralis TaxID=66376 RepID=UPI0033FAB6F0
MGRLDGRVALISGGARGQGEAEARLFVAEGASVVIGDVLDEEGRKVAESLGAAARYVHLDVTQPEHWSAAVGVAVKEFGKLDALVNNAGIARYGALRDFPLADYLKVVQVNQVGVFLGMKAVVEAMSAAGGGTIVNISSAGGLAGVTGTTAYCATKFAVRGMTKVAAIELGPLGIRVNSVHPGGVDTPMNDQAADIDLDFSEDPNKKLPLGRIGRPEEVADMVLFLTSGESSYSTGSEFVLDGGMLAGPLF